MLVSGRGRWALSQKRKMIRKWGGSIVNRQVLISFYCQCVAGLVHFWNIYTGGTLYAAFSPVRVFFYPLNLYFKTETITGKPRRNELILPVMLKQRKKRTFISYKWIMFPFQSKNGITAMASFARDTRLITADSAGLLLFSSLLSYCLKQPAISC